MKKFILGFTTCLLISIPLFVFSAPNLSERLKGKILLAVEDHGKTYYVHEDGKRYRITVATAQKIFEKLALGITNNNLAEIPESDVGINPEIKVLGECAEIKCEPEIIYIDKLGQCNYGIYTDRITKLTKELDETTKIVKEYEQMMEECLDIAGAIDVKTKAENALRKEYGLRINALNLEILEIRELNKYSYSELSQYYQANQNPGGELTWKLLKELFSKPRSVNLSATNIFGEEITNRDIEIGFLNNELQRKLLELQ